jgi:hypothetical protein
MTAQTMRSDNGPVRVQEHGQKSSSIHPPTEHMVWVIYLRRLFASLLGTLK